MLRANVPGSRVSPWLCLWVVVVAAWAGCGGPRVSATKTHRPIDALRERAQDNPRDTALWTELAVAEHFLGAPGCFAWTDLTATAVVMPMITPTATTRAPCATTMRLTRAASAPNAIRTPISRVR